MILGQCRITLKPVASPAPQPPAAQRPQAHDIGAAPAARRPYAVFQVRLADGAQGEYPLLKPTTTLGRGEDNDIILESSMISRRHLELVMHFE
ncbi:MAG: FHA domain-containing protein [Anaerolineae bacterium]